MTSPYMHEAQPAPLIDRLKELGTALALEAAMELDVLTRRAQRAEREAWELGEQIAARRSGACAMRTSCSVARRGSPVTDEIDPIVGRCTGESNTPWRPFWCHLPFGHHGAHAWTTVPPVIEPVPAALRGVLR